LAVEGGLLVSIERLNSIAIDHERKMAVVGPGAITGDIMKAAESSGLFYPPTRPVIWNRPSAAIWPKTLAACAAKSTA